jgi:hypothetical protein
VRTRPLALCAFVLAAGCAPAPPMPDPPASHPASPAADEAPERAPGQTLAMPPQAPAPAGRGNPQRGH